MKQALFVALLLLPLSAAAQTTQPSSSRSEMQAMQNEMAVQLQAKLQFEAQVIDLTAKVSELQAKLDAVPKPPSPGKKD